MAKKVVKLWCHFSIPTVFPVRQHGSDLMPHILQETEPTPLWLFFPPSETITLLPFLQHMKCQAHKLYTVAHILITLPKTYT